MIPPSPRWRALALVAVTCCAGVVGTCAQDRPEDVVTLQRSLGTFNVLTRSYDNQRTGANLSETVLTTANVNTTTFGKLFELPVDDQIYAGVLYASGVTIGGGSRNVLYVATMNNTVYAFDADTGTQLWSRNFNNGFVPVFHTDVGQNCGVYQDISGNIGVVGTPVIDGAAQTLFVVTRTREGTAFKQRLRALDIASGNERVGARDIGALSPQPINPQTNHQHAALALSQGKVYVAWASHCDTGPYSGRVVAFNAADLAHVATFNVTGNSDGMAGIWMSGAAPVIDGSGNLFYATGNGARNGTTQFGESIVKLSPTLGVVRHFTPASWQQLNGGDLDLGSSGPVVVPGTSSIVMGGKGGGTCYLVDMTDMGGPSGLQTGDTQIRQKWQCVDLALRPNDPHHLHNAMVAWSGPAGTNLYTWGENDFLRVWRLNGASGQFDTTPVMVGNVVPNLGMPGGMMTLSANGSTSGTAILWVSIPLSGDANQDDRPGVLRAFNAEDVTQQLWNSTMLVADDSKEFSKGSIPLVANGKVYLGSLSHVVNVYGLRTASPDPDRTEGGLASGTGSACNGIETVNEAYDNVLVRPDSTTSKWCVLSAPSTTVPISTVYDFPGTTAFAITRYTLTTGNDADDRDPRDWTFQGCQGSCSVDSDTGWITLDTRTGQFPVGSTSRFQTNTYAFTNATAFQQYRLRVTANNGATDRFQIAELQMFGASGTCVPETDPALCARLGKNCGTLSATDNCGAARTVSSCGTCTVAGESCGGGGTPNVCGSSGGTIDRTEGGTASGNATACNTTTETVDRAYDNRMTSADFSKWCVTRAPTTSNPVSTSYNFAGSTAFVITRYTITTGNDVPSRDPRDWTLQGCPDESCMVGVGTGWVTLDTRTNQFAGAARFQTNSYTFGNTTAYRQYRLRVTANNGATTRFQIAELQLF